MLQTKIHRSSKAFDASVLQSKATVQGKTVGVVGVVSYLFKRALECYSSSLPTPVNLPGVSDEDEILHGTTETFHMRDPHLPIFANTQIKPEAFLTC